MIVDCHAHIWQSPEQIALRGGGGWSRSARAAAEQARSGWRGQATIEQHQAASKPVDITLVLGFQSGHLRAEIPNSLIAEAVRQRPDRVVGFAGVDPTDLPRAREQVLRARDSMGLKGIVVAPAAQAMHPAHSQAMQVYELAARLGMPVVIHNGPPMPGPAHLEYARPYLLDEIARSFASLRILITHLGYPWADETFVLLAKHDNVFAEISGIAQKPWLTLHYMQAAHELGVMDKLLFGSDWPFSTPKAVIESLYSLNQIVHGTNLPAVPREQLRGIVERNSLALLGIEGQVKTAASPPAEPDEGEPARPDAVISSEPEQTA